MKYMYQLVRTPARFAHRYENAQKRILEVFSKWKAPANFKIELFVVRVGEWGGHMLVDCDDPAAVHKVMLDLPCIRIPGATGDSRRGRCPGRARSHCLARWAETQLTSESEDRFPTTCDVTQFLILSNRNNYTSIR